MTLHLPLPTLMARAHAVKTATVGHRVYLRGLIEFSNRCRKNCYYCGIRHGNRTIGRYELTDEEVLQAVDFAWRNRYGSIVLQSGERQSAHFTARITRLLQQIKRHTQGQIGITLSCGEQSYDVYRQWFEAGAHRYLLRIETSSPALYAKIHPCNPTHDFNTRLAALHHLKTIGYLTGTGVMIGLPFQTIDDLANDLLFFQQMNIDMVGMGPYIAHRDTPLYRYHTLLPPPAQRLELALKMVAALRLLMPHINIAAATALQTLHPTGREQAIRAGANVFMPNLTPMKYRHNYRLYDNKPCLNDAPNHCHDCIATRIRCAGEEIGYGEWGDRTNC
ncbi:MAG: [FeFe] hydrogenase H-cluster radical SAM maturase HydE [Prevotellaceae bacterium]|jgi:biotin synthase|nr:[FeFe] hydrogenase H-cluster radical SAM maturase HydE [Prevotellaceae bacterium]